MLQRIRNTWSPRTHTRPPRLPKSGCNLLGEARIRLTSHLPLRCLPIISRAHCPTPCSHAIGTGQLEPLVHPEQSQSSTYPNRAPMPGPSRSVAPAQPVNPDLLWQTTFGQAQQLLKELLAGEATASAEAFRSNSCSAVRFVPQQRAPGAAAVGAAPAKPAAAAPAAPPAKAAATAPVAAKAVAPHASEGEQGQVSANALFLLRAKVFAIKTCLMDCLELKYVFWRARRYSSALI